MIKSKIWKSRFYGRWMVELRVGQYDLLPLYMQFDTFEKARDVVAAQIEFMRTANG